jgi:hypothetical protein
LGVGWFFLWFLLCDGRSFKKGSEDVGIVLVVAVLI